MRSIRLLALVCGLAAALLYGLAWGKKKKEEETQTLQLPKDPPAAVTAETRRLIYHVTPLSAKGLLSQQTRDALKWLLRSSNGATVVKLRAFVAGSGDLRRVGELVSETFTEHKLNLPVLSVVQVGMLPLEGAQIVIESTAMAKKDVNDFGLAYISAQGSSSAGPLDPVLPLAKQSLERLATAVHAAGSEPDDVLRVTCFLSTLDKFAEVRGLVASAYSSAALDFMQIRRAPTHALAECEAVARLRSNSSAAMHVINPEGLPQSAQLSQVAVIGAPRVVLTSSQQAFGYQDADARLAFQRLQKSLSQEDGSLSRAAFVSFYPLSASISAQVRKISAEFCDRARPPAGTLLPFEGLPSIDSGFAMDVVAVKE